MCLSVARGAVSVSTQSACSKQVEQTNGGPDRDMPSDICTVAGRRLRMTVCAAPAYLGLDAGRLYDPRQAPRYYAE